MRDFLPSDVRKRNYVINIIKEVYESYGFEPLETPSVENLETLTGKYGEEGNQLMFKILKRGEKLQGELNADEIKSEKDLSDLALRYDLTVPLARVVANHKNDLPKFFKRYQIQPVWRADRPARGRYREFYQCDVDAIGSSSMMVEAELCAAISEILTRLGFEDFIIRVNHRKILTGILQASGIPIEKHSDALVALDKLDKIGREGVEKEFIQRGIADESGVKLLNVFEIAEKLSEFRTKIERSEEKMQFLQSIFENWEKTLGKPKRSLYEIYTGEKSDLIYPNEKEIEKTKGLINSYGEIKQSLLNTLTIVEVKNFVGENEVGTEGIADTNNVFEFTKSNSRIKFDPSLARGLSYYTGAIFEVNVPDFAGSIAGGGRYDGLIGMFGKEQIPAVGFSIGLERILLIMEERGMFPKDLADASADVMVTIWNEDSIGESLKLAAELRRENLRVLVYPEADKLGKQFKYADSIKIPFVCVLGESELPQNKVTLKNLQTGAQETVEREKVAEKIASRKL